MGYGRRWWRRIKPWKAKRPVRRAWRVRKARLIAGFGGVRWRDRDGSEKGRDDR